MNGCSERPYSPQGTDQNSTRSRKDATRQQPTCACRPVSLPLPRAPASVSSSQHPHDSLHAPPLPSPSPCYGCGCDSAPASPPSGPGLHPSQLSAPARSRMPRHNRACRRAANHHPKKNRTRHASPWILLHPSAFRALTSPQSPARCRCLPSEHPPPPLPSSPCLSPQGPDPLSHALYRHHDHHNHHHPGLSVFSQAKEPELLLHGPDPLGQAPCQVH